MNSERTLTGCLGSLLMAFCMLAWSPVYGDAGDVDGNGIFQLDGNATDDGAGDDWENIADGSDSADQTTNGDPGGIVNDVSTNADDVFDQGGSKDVNDTDEWMWKIAKATPDKDNLTDAYAAAYTDTNSDQLIYFGADRFANNGDAQLGFWFFQADTNNEPGGTFSPVHTIGDILVLINFTRGGEIGIAEVLKWVDSCTPDSTAVPPVVCADTHLQVLTEFGECGDTSNTTHACAINNPGTETTDGEVSYWDYDPKFGTTDFFPKNSLIEGGINLTAIFNGNDVPCFASFMAETRTSQSEDATLKDFVLGRFPLCAIETAKLCKTQSLILNPGQDPIASTDVVVLVTNAGSGSYPLASSSLLVCDDPSGSASLDDPICSTDDIQIHTGTPSEVGVCLSVGGNLPASYDDVELCYSNGDCTNNCSVNGDGDFSGGETLAVTGSFDIQNSSGTSTNGAGAILSGTALPTLSDNTDVDVDCGQLTTTAMLYVDKMCDVSLHDTGSALAIRVDASGTYCNTGDAGLIVDVTDDEDTADSGNTPTTVATNVPLYAGTPCMDASDCKQDGGGLDCSLYALCIGAQKVCSVSRTECINNDDCGGGSDLCQDEQGVCVAESVYDALGGECDGNGTGVDEGTECCDDSQCGTGGDCVFTNAVCGLYDINYEGTNPSGAPMGKCSISSATVCTSNSDCIASASDICLFKADDLSFEDQVRVVAPMSKNGTLSADEEAIVSATCPLCEDGE